MARCFLDFEPGIHYPQLQMQAGTTGVDLRCYSMTRQAKDQDPNGTFIRRYVEELSGICDGSVREPWKALKTNAGAVNKYPSRIVDEVKTAKASKLAIANLQKWFTSGACGEPPREFTATSTSRSRVTTTADDSEGDDDGEQRNSRNVLTLLQRDSSKGREESLAPCQHEAKTSIQAQIVDAAEEADSRPTKQQRRQFTAVLKQVPQKWSCPRCTLVNGDGCAPSEVPGHCDACGFPRPDMAHQKPTVVIELD